MYELSSIEPFLDLEWISKVKVQDPSFECLKSNISKMVRKRERVNKEDTNLCIDFQIN